MATAALPLATPAPDRRAVAGWVMYDLGNVLFSINIVSLYFPLWVVDNAGGRDAHVGIDNSLAMILVFLAAPILGIFADRTGRRIPFLAVSTIACSGLTAALGHGGLWVSLVLFAMAAAVLSCGLVFYDALLPVVSTEANRGRVSGYGIGSGFAGALLGIAAGGAVLAIDKQAKPTVFVMTAILLILSSLPCFLWVRESPSTRKIPIVPALRASTQDLRGSLAQARRLPWVARFLVGRIFYTDAANPIFAFMGIYATKEVGFSDAQTQLVLASGILTGPIGAILAGRATDRIGPNRTLDRLLMLWTVVLTLCTAIPVLDLPCRLFWLVAPLGGIAFGGTGTADRALLFRLAPPSQTGRFSGLFAMAAASRRSLDHLCGLLRLIGSIGGGPPPLRPWS